MKRNNSIKVFDQTKKERINYRLKGYGLKVRGGSIETKTDNTKVAYISFENAGATINMKKLGYALRTILRVDEVVIDGQLAG